MLSRKEYWQNRKDRVSCIIHLCESERSERAIFYSFLIVLQLKRSILYNKYQILCNLIFKKWGYICIGHPPPQKWGGGYIPPPPHPPGIYASDLQPQLGPGYPSSKAHASRSGCALRAHNLLRPLYLKILDPPLNIMHDSA